MPDYYFPHVLFLDGALVVARYVNQVKNEKRSAKKSRLDSEEAFRLVPNRGRYAAIPSPALDTVYPRNSMGDFNPYDEASGPSNLPGPSNAYDSGPPPPIEAGYGGGSWTHQEISEEEKARMKRLDEEAGFAPPPTSEYDEDEAERRRRDIKSPNGPPSSTRRREMDDLPRYTLSDPS